MRRVRRLLVCGIASSIVYVTALIVCPLAWPEYSSVTQTISELSAIGAPSRSMWLPFGLVHSLLLCLFGVGVWRRASGRKGLRVAAVFIVVMGVMGPLWPPMHLRGTVFSLTDTMHIAFASAQVLFTLVAIGSSAAALGRGFRVFSAATIAALLVAGGFTGAEGPKIAANLPTPWVGITERIDLAAYLLWIVVLAAALLREDPRAPGLGPAT